MQSSGDRTACLISPREAHLIEIGEVSGTLLSRSENQHLSPDEARAWLRRRPGLEADLKATRGTVQLTNSQRGKDSATAEGS